MKRRSFLGTLAALLAVGAGRPCGYALRPAEDILDPARGIEETLDGDEWSREHFRRRYPRRP